MITIKDSDLVKRALWTFVQAALAVLIVTDEPFTSAALIAALGAGLSALKTFLVNKRDK